jgi:hypothetical protein
MRNRCRREIIVSFSRVPAPEPQALTASSESTGPDSPQSERPEGVVNELIQAGAIADRRKGVAPIVLAQALTESIEVHTAERRGRSSAGTALGSTATAATDESRLGIGPWPRPD